MVILDLRSLLTKLGWPFIMKTAVILYSKHGSLHKHIGPVIWVSIRVQSPTRLPSETANLVSYSNHPLEGSTELPYVHCSELHSILFRDSCVRQGWRLNPTSARNWRYCAWFVHSKASITSLTWHLINLINDPIKLSYTSTVCSMAVTRRMLRKKRWLRWSPLLRFLSLQIKTVCCIRPLVTIVCIESGAYAMTFGIYRQVVTAAQPDF